MKIILLYLLHTTLFTLLLLNNSNTFTSTTSKNLKPLSFFSWKKMVEEKQQLKIKDALNLDEKISGRSITIGWLLDSLRTNDEYYKKLHGHRGVKEVTYSCISEGKGFLSIILRCVITFIDSIDEFDIYSTVIKIPGTESLEDAQKKCQGDNWFKANDEKLPLIKAHENECNFYKNVSQILGETPIPKVYLTREWIYGKQEGCIHMEDLTIRGKTLSFFDNINLSQVKSFIRALAKMNKNCLMADQKIWKGKYLSQKEESYKQILIIFNKMSNNFMEKSSLKHLLEPIAKKHHSFFLNHEFLVYAARDAAKEIGIEPVIVHGDMNPNNIMWSINEKDEIQNDIISFLDWQCMHEGSPMYDLARFLCLCSDGVVRRQAENFAIDYYLECLTQEFGGDSKKVPYTFDKLKKAYDFAFLTHAILSLGTVSFYLNSIENQKTIPINENIKNAYRDFGTLKALHMYEDIDRILSGEEMKKVYEKFEKQSILVENI